MPISTGLWWLAQDRAAGGAPPTVVLALGTNDSESGLGFIYMVQAEIDYAMALNPGERIFMVNYDTVPGLIPNLFPSYSPAAKNAHNAALDLVVSIDQANLHVHISIINWQATMAPYANQCPAGVTYTTPTNAAGPCFVDGVHTDEAGFLLRTEMIHNAVGGPETNS